MNSQAPTNVTLVGITVAKDSDSDPGPQAVRNSFLPLLSTSILTFYPILLFLLDSFKLPLVKKHSSSVYTPAYIHHPGCRKNEGWRLFCPALPQTKPTIVCRSLPCKAFPSHLKMLLPITPQVWTPSALGFSQPIPSPTAPYRQQSDSLP